MPTSSLEELRGQISAGKYGIDSGELAGEILTKFALVRRVGRLLMTEEAGPEPRPRRQERPAPARVARPPREQLS